MLGWMLYFVTVSAVLSLAALAAEHAARLRGAATRWTWCQAMIGSLVVPALMCCVSIQLPDLGAASGAAHGAVALRTLTWPALAPAALLPAPASGLAAWDTILSRVWLAGSGAMLLVLLAGFLRLAWCRRGWAAAEMAGCRVLVAPEAGPAVTLLPRPCIVVPRWLLGRPAAEQRLVIAHEQSHLAARDPQLLLLALTLLVVMPWNLPLGWQLRRLRFAIAVDCDARVLRQGHDVSQYGETLIAVGARRASALALVPAMAGSPSSLEQRIRTMVRKETKFGWALAAGLTGVALALAASAAEVSPPGNDGAAAPKTEAPLRRLVDSMVAGKPDYQDLTPKFAEVVRGQPALQAGLASLGPVQSVTYLGTGADGVDAYTVVQQNGAMHWRIKLNNAGMIAGAVVTNGP
jgi:Zn-dependent protease with chaperone function